MGQVKDEIGFNRHRANTLYVLLFFSDLVCPVVLTACLDENCLRGYLNFSEDINKIMEYWDNVNFQGAAAYRPGFCLQKLVVIYSPIWLVQASMSAFLASSVTLVQNTVPYNNIMYRIRGLNQEEHKKEQLEDAQEKAQSEIASLLVNMTTGIGFGLWSPLLVLFTSILFAVRSLTLQICELMPQNDSLRFEKRLVAHVSVPVPNKLLGRLSLASVWFSIFGVLYDFGFAIGPWIAFTAMTVAHIGFYIWVRHKQPRLPEQHRRDWRARPRQTFCDERSNNSVVTSLHAVDFQQPTTRKLSCIKFKS